MRPDNIIEIKVIGDQTVQSVRAMGDKVIALSERLIQSGLSVRVLDMLDDIGSVPQEARRLVVELARELEYDKLAMVGKSGAIRVGANLMLHATGKGDKVRFFTDREEAVSWLNFHEKDKPPLIIASSNSH